MRVVVLGADGYLGWPTALHLSARGHEVVAADSLIRRRWDVLCGTESLVPIAIPGLSKVVQISAGYTDTFALLAGGTL